MQDLELETSIGLNWEHGYFGNFGLKANALIVCWQWPFLYYLDHLIIFQKGIKHQGPRTSILNGLSSENVPLNIKKILFNF